MSLGLRQTKFQLELVNVEELKEKRYTRVGHKATAAQGAHSYTHWQLQTGSQWTYIVSPLGGLHASYIELSSELFV